MPNQNKRSVVVVGSFAYDRIMSYAGKFSDSILPEKIHAISVSFYINSLQERFGGTGGNIAYSLARLGHKARLVASGGKDSSGYRAWLKGHGVDIAHLKERQAHVTAAGYVMTDRADNQITAFYAGAMHVPAWSKGHLKNFRAMPDLVIVSPTNGDDMRTAAADCKKRGIPYIFDPGQQIPHLSGSDLKKCIDGAFMLIVNDYELELIQKKTKWSRQAIVGKVSVLVTTFGEGGSEIVAADGAHRVPVVKPRKLVDPTGAGDAYRAGLIAAYLRGLPWEVAGRVASIVASYPIEYHGTQEHNFTWDAIRRRYKHEFGSAL